MPPRRPPPRLRPPRAEPAPAPPASAPAVDRHPISRRAASVEASGIRRMFELVASMPDPINLSIGQAHFDVPGPVKQAAVAAIESDFSRYTVTQGLPELNRGVLAKLAAREGPAADLSGARSIITAGVSGGLMLGFMALLDPGDEVLVTDPYFTMYPVLARMCSAVPVTYDLYPGRPLDEAALEAAITPRTRLILVNSPSNPTGRTLGDGELRAVGSVAEAHGLVVMSDEIYDEFVYDGPHVSAFGRVPADRLMVLGGWSKTYGMPGWRLGWAVGLDEIVDAMRRMQQFSFVCAPSLVQKAGLAALDVDMSAEIADYRRKRDLLVAGLAGHYEIVPPGGSFYMFPRLPGGLDGDGFLKQALERSLLLVPGKTFSAHDSHFRLSFAADDRVLERGIAALIDIAESVAGG